MVGISFTSLVFSIDLFQRFSSTRDICRNDFQSCTVIFNLSETYVTISVATVAQTVEYTVAQNSLDNPIGTQALTGALKLRTNFRQHE